jgi:hypothetical protein
VTIEPTFLLNCRPAIAMMRGAGMNEVQIACVVTEVRSAAISWEFLRLQELIRTYPPTHYDHGTMAYYIAEWCPREEPGL